MPVVNRGLSTEAVVTSGTVTIPPPQSIGSTCPTRMILSVDTNAALAGDRVDVLDTHAEASGEVHRRLDREDHPRLELGRLGRDQLRILTAIDPDPVTAV